MSLFVPRCLLFLSHCRLFLTEVEREWTHTTSSPGSASVTKGGSVRHPEFCPRAWLISRPRGGRKGGKGGVGVGRGALGGGAFTWGSTRLAARWWAAAGTEPAQWGWCFGGETYRLLRKKERQSPWVREHRRQRSRKTGGPRPSAYRTR